MVTFPGGAPWIQSRCCSGAVGAQRNSLGGITISRDPALASMGLQELQKGARSLCAEQHKGIRISRLGASYGHKALVPLVALK